MSRAAPTQPTPLAPREPDTVDEVQALRLTLNDYARQLAASREALRDAKVILAALQPGTGSALARLAGAIIRLGDGTKRDHVPRDTDAEGYTPGCGCSGRCSTPQPDVATKGTW